MLAPCRAVRPHLCELLHPHLHVGLEVPGVLDQPGLVLKLDRLDRLHLSQVS